MSKFIKGRKAKRKSLNLLEEILDELKKLNEQNQYHYFTFQSRHMGKMGATLYKVNKKTELNGGYKEHVLFIGDTGD